jgi:hypothetical protein
LITRPKGDGDDAADGIEREDGKGKKCEVAESSARGAEEKWQSVALSSVVRGLTPALPECLLRLLMRNEKIPEEGAELV